MLHLAAALLQPAASSTTISPTPTFRCYSERLLFASVAAVPAVAVLAAAAAAEGSALDVPLRCAGAGRSRSGSDILSMYCRRRPLEMSNIVMISSKAAAVIAISVVVEVAIAVTAAPPTTTWVARSTTSSSIHGKDRPRRPRRRVVGANNGIGKRAGGGAGDPRTASSTGAASRSWVGAGGRARRR